jgi:hypothetical protein
MRIFSALFVLLTGCALAPDSVRPELEHMSHLSEHFGSNQQEYAVNIVNAIAHWDLTKRAYFEIAEGYNISPHWIQYNSFGEIVGNNREETSVRVGYVFEIPKK